LKKNRESIMCSSLRRKPAHAALAGVALDVRT
jgi:hypothetical protein